MKRVDDMSARLPPLYREGERVRQILDQPGVQIEVLGRACHARPARPLVQRHVRARRGSCTRRVARLAGGAVADAAGTLRAWVHAQRDATLIEGAVTVGGIERYVAHTRGFEDATDIASMGRPSSSNSRGDDDMRPHQQSEALRRCRASPWP